MDFSSQNQMNVLSQIEGGARRLTEIVRILAKYGIAEWLGEADSNWIDKRLLSAGGEHLTHRSTEERIRLALTELGTSGIKLGQMLSTRPDLVGAELATELAKLQAETEPDAKEAIDKTLHDELGEALLEKHFARIDPEPIASASIAQVHRAELKSGEQVVIKVMHGGIEDRVHRDLDLIALLAELMERHSPVLRQYRPVATARHFRHTLLRELDFGYERLYLQRFAANFAKNPNVHIPKVYPDLSSRRALTMEFLEGIPVTDREALAAGSSDLEEFARRGASMYLDMIFRDGFYHADPHPGNLFLLEGNVVGVVDCGMVGQIDATLREEIEEFLLASVAQDTDELVEILCRIGLVPARLDRVALERELSEILADYSQQPLDQLDFGGAINRMTNLIRSYHLVLPQGFALLFKTLVMLEGTGRQLNPSFNLTELLAPYYRKALRRRLAPRRMLGRAAHSYRDWRRMFDKLPRDLSDILARARNGSLEIHLEHRSLEGTVDRLVQGILSAAVFVGASMMLSSQLAPTIGGISIIGLIGLVASSALGLPLLHAIRKSSKQRKREAEE